MFAKIIEFYWNLFLIGFQKSCVGSFPSPVSDRKDNGLKKKDFEDMAVVGLDAMQRANSTLEDFVSYLIDHLL